MKETRITLTGTPSPRTLDEFLRAMKLPAVEFTTMPNNNYMRPHAPCAQCPFKCSSTPGWFGPYKPEDYLATAHSELLLQCHMTSAGGIEKARHCTGVALFRSLILKEPRVEFKIIHQDVCVKKYGTASILAGSAEFRQHHMSKSAAVWSGLFGKAK